MVYISSSFWLLVLGSRDLSQSEKEITSWKAEQIHKITTIFTQKVVLRQSKAKLQKEGIFYLIHLFARDILLMLETEETKTI